jgi:hypothetical protein
MKLRFVLPSINLVASAAALIHDNLFGFARRDPEPSAAMLVCYLINAPAVVIRRAAEYALGKLIPGVCSAVYLEFCYRAERISSLAVFMAGLGFLWYLVGRGVEAEWLSRGRAAESPDWRRTSLDVAVILFAVLCAVIGVLNWGDRSYPLNLPLPFLAYTLWALVLAILCGRDLARCSSRGGSEGRPHGSIGSS